MDIVMMLFDNNKEESGLGVTTSTSGSCMPGLFNSLDFMEFL